MKPEDIRRELDRGPNITVLRPKADAERAEGGVELAHVWADDIELDLGKPGLIDGLLGTTGMTVLYGESGAGKTFVAIDLACHVAAGLPWRGKDVEQGVVVYVAAEAPESVKRRVWAWKKRYGVEHLPLVVVTASVDLLNGSTDKVLALISRLREQHGRVALVVIDTLARAMTGNENAPDDMGRFVAACGRVREASEGHVLVVHHTGKDLAKGARGHSCLRAATDVELEVTSGEAGGCITVTKHRDEPGASRFGFRLEAVELGKNAKGRTVTTCVAVETEALAKRDAKAKPRRLNDKGTLLRKAVETAARYAPERPPPHEETSGVTAAVPVTVARAYWRQLIGWEEATEREKVASRQDWKRGLENAVAAGAVKRWGDWLWLS
jgi:KaiC/GvpD/RAD55 family RecA-like ATPase